MYAIVDIETTGGYASANGITEICIHLFDGEKTTQVFNSLINPHQSIPRYIQAMTGISDEMVANAPSFSEVAEEIHTLLSDRIFVAHNVNFDHSFIRAHLAHCGYTLNVKKLCTVRLARKIIPGHLSYSLGRLCDALGIVITDRHRAGGDTAATVALFTTLLQQDVDGFIVKSLGKGSKEQMLPPNVPKEQFSNLPYSPGVYYFHDQKGKIIYVGKAKNIRYRVNSHFSTNSDSRQRQNFLKHTHSISYRECATELMAHILESTEIKKYWPAFNYSQKRAESIYGIFDYVDQNGYLRLAIEKNKKNLYSSFTFNILLEGQTVLRKLIRDFNLCPKLCFMQTEGACEGEKEGYCSGACRQQESPEVYNKRVEQALASLESSASYAIIDKGMNGDEQSCVLMWKGSFYGMGCIPADVAISHAEELKDLLTPYKENAYIRNLVHGYAAKNPRAVRLLVV